MRVRKAEGRPGVFVPHRPADCPVEKASAPLLRLVVINDFTHPSSKTTPELQRTISIDKKGHAIEKFSRGREACSPQLSGRIASAPSLAVPDTCTDAASDDPHFTRNTRPERCNQPITAFPDTSAYRERGFKTPFL